ncbi:hypothetical protein MPB2EB_1441 [Mycoavidus sp. B2-EB]|nr:hypothetical protein MPB2EB_1441 [Mycoavidus sp. B2-EB]
MQILCSFQVAQQKTSLQYFGLISSTVTLMRVVGLAKFSPYVMFHLLNYGAIPSVLVFRLDQRRRLLKG